MSGTDGFDDLVPLTSLPEVERRELAHDVVRRLGKSWRVDTSDATDAAALIHVPTRLSFALVPGGTFQMGLSDTDLAAAAEYVDWESGTASYVSEHVAVARPVHAVHVLPFAMSRSLLTAKDVNRLSKIGLPGDPRYNHALSRDEARAFARSLGFRLPSEAELEWVARDGGSSAFVLNLTATARRIESDDDDDDDEIIVRPAMTRSRFGVQDLFTDQWAEDDWHASYEGAPNDSLPWMEGEPQGVQRGAECNLECSGIQGLLGQLCGIREPGRSSRASVRLALPLGT